MPCLGIAVASAAVNATRQQPRTDDVCLSADLLNGRRRESDVSDRSILSVITVASRHHSANAAVQ